MQSIQHTTVALVESIMQLNCVKCSFLNMEGNNFMHQYMGADQLGNGFTEEYLMILMDQEYTLAIKKTNGNVSCTRQKQQLEGGDPPYSALVRPHQEYCVQV